MKTIKEYLDENRLIHGGGHIPTKGQRARQRKKMRKYWQYKGTTFDDDAEDMRR